MTRMNKTKTLTSYRHKFRFQQFWILAFASTILPMMRMSNGFMFVPSLSSKILYNTGNSVVRSTFPKNTPSNTILSMSLRAWTCHGSSQKDMVEKLSLAGIIKSTPVRNALLLVDRANYVHTPTHGYIDAPQTTGYGQTISAPHMHSHALEEIVPTLIKFSKKEEVEELKVLDVGCGSGYLTAAFGRLFYTGQDNDGMEMESQEDNETSPDSKNTLLKGRVWGIEVVPELVNLSIQNIQTSDSDLLHSGTVTIQHGNGWEGLPSQAPYHAIHIGAAAEVFPQKLLMQLTKGGVMVIPVGEEKGLQNLYRVVRVKESEEFREEDFEMEHLFAVRYVPLINPSKTP